MGKILGTTMLAILVLAGTASAQGREHTRQGFWFSAGLGAGSLGCKDCDGRTGGLSGQLSLGGTVSQKLLLGASSNAWTKSEDGVTLRAATLTAAVRFYPSATGGFFLTGGLGLGSVDLDISGLGSGSRTGTGALLGLGIDVRIGRNASLTPFWNVSGIAIDGGDANFGQIGLSITAH